MSAVLLIRCIGCGAPLGNQVPSEGALAHVRTCERHPLARELAHLRAQRDDLQARNTELVMARRSAEQQLRERDEDFDRVASVGRKALARAEAAEAELKTIRPPVIPSAREAFATLRSAGRALHFAETLHADDTGAQLRAQADLSNAAFRCVHAATAAVDLPTGAPPAEPLELVPPLQPTAPEPPPEILSCPTCGTCPGGVTCKCQDPACPCWNRGAGAKPTTETAL